MICLPCPNVRVILRDKQRQQAQRQQREVHPQKKRTHRNTDTDRQL